MEIREQRVEFVVRALGGREPFSLLCREFDISRPTGYLWLARYREGGVAAIEERSRRPLRSPTQTAPELEACIRALREVYPDWGARKLAVLLRREGIGLPSSTIHRVLLRLGLVRDVDRHQPAVKRFEREQPNELWQMDFKGPKNWPKASTALSVIDDHSRYLVALEATARPEGALVRGHLERAFIECGLPDAMLMDHGIPWWNHQSFGGSTQLSLWLMRQGIRLCFSGIRHPQTQGKVERFHGSLERALNHRGVPAKDHQQWLDAFRREHNYIRPHEALDMQTPASRWQPSLRRYNPNPPAWEYPEGAWTLKIDNHGTIDIHEQSYRIAKSLIGERVRVVETGERYLIYYCNTLIRELDPATKRSTIIERFVENQPPTA
ncbi:MAG: IS481 family transposase [Terracidiphilus sp.]